MGESHTSPGGQALAVLVQVKLAQTLAEIENQANMVSVSTHAHQVLFIVSIVGVKLGKIAHNLSVGLQSVNQRAFTCKDRERDMERTGW